MKKTPFFCFLALLVIFSFIGAAFIGDDDESSRDQFCNAAVDAVLVPVDCLAKGVSFVLTQKSSAPRILISYIAQHEKSPPYFSFG
jgi:hypothetical protein